eukprot:1880858-Prymnesium_polylepis.2
MRRLSPRVQQELHELDVFDDAGSVEGCDAIVASLADAKVRVEEHPRRLEVPQRAGRVERGRTVLGRLPTPDLTLAGD